jgi:hypothetical protein
VECGRSSARSEPLGPTIEAQLLELPAAIASRRVRVGRLSAPYACWTSVDCFSSCRRRSPRSGSECTWTIGCGVKGCGVWGDLDDPEIEASTLDPLPTRNAQCSGLAIILWLPDQRRGVQCQRVNSMTPRSRPPPSTPYRRKTLLRIGDHLMAAGPAARSPMSKGELDDPKINASTLDPLPTKNAAQDRRSSHGCRTSGEESNVKG